MKTHKLLLISLITTLSCGTVAQESSPEYLQSDWAQQALWNDGKAEVAKYQAERIVYGKVRSFEYIYVLVKEDFNQEFQVKTDSYDRQDLFPVMKVNKFARLETDVYPYHYLTSVFYKQGSPHVVYKLTNTSQEWCGNTAKSFLLVKNGYQFDYFSYWDGQGNGQTRVKAGIWFEDQLSYTLRTLRFADGLTFERPLYPTQVTNKANKPEPIASKFEVTVADSVDLEGIVAPDIEKVWKVTITRADGVTQAYWFTGTYPNYLLKMESSDGQKLTLKSLVRDAYWEHE